MGVWEIRKIAKVFPYFSLLTGPSRQECRLGPVRLTSVVVLEPSSCRAAKERVLRRSAVAADCNSELAAEVGMFAAQVVRNVHWSRWH